MALVRLGWLPGWGTPAVVSEGLGSLPLLWAGVREPAETPLTNEGLDLILEVDAVISVVAMVLVETIIFGLVFPVRRGP